MLKRTLFALTTCLVSAATSSIAEEMSAAETFTFLLTQARPSSPAPYEFYPLEVSDDFDVRWPEIPEAAYSVSVEDPCKPIMEIKVEEEVQAVVTFDMSNFLGVTESTPKEPRGYWMEIAGDCPVTWDGQCASADKTRFMFFYRAFFGAPERIATQIPEKMMQELYDAADHYKQSYCPA